jgi:hypothetical protein
LRTATGVQLPSGPPIFSERSPVFRALVAVRKYLGTGRSQVQILPFRPFLEGRQIKAGCTCLETRIGTRRGRSVTDAFRQNLTPNERKSYATCHPLPKPVALSQELQTKSRHSNPTDGPAERHFSSDAAVRFETATGTRLIAQKVSAHGHQHPVDNRKTGARTEVLTCRDDQLLARYQPRGPFRSLTP